MFNALRRPCLKSQADNRYGIAAQLFHRFGPSRCEFHSLFFAILLAFTPPALAQAAEPVRLMLYGDSLLAGYGLAEEQAFEAQLEGALAENGYEVEIINASVSGDTTAGGVSRLDWALGDRPDAVVLALGGNDILRAIDPASTRQNLTAMMERFDAEGIPVLLAGMRAPTSLGPEYQAAFDPIYPELALEYEAEYYPFLLDGVAGDRSLNQNDGIHPNQAGAKEMVTRMLPVIQTLLDGLDGRES
ncbi:MAG: arylesterase [Alphaproteobacteria bacterium]|nr:arylesterase [Alphaproteobacteria bacterium SS10]